MTIGSVTPHDFPAALATETQRGWDAPAPVSLTPLIGRRTELETAAAMLRRRTTRLLTLTGTGGIGKTRLAIEIAARVEVDFDDGVAWVSLAPIHAPDAVIGTIAAQLGITGVAVTERLDRALRERQLLLFLDNFEQVVEAAPQVAALLGACPLLQIVVTSRARLRIRGERVLPVPPLSQSHVPDSAVIAGKELPHLAPLTLHSEAVTLFMERAQSVVPSIDVSEANTAVVSEICRHLDGLPLAIELAAARVSHMPLQTLLVRMDRRLPLLVEGDRDMPARLQTMRNAIAWSYDLLTPAERRVFRCLSVFDNGFRLDAAEAVVKATSESLGGTDVIDAASARATLDLIAALVEHSLVRHESGTDETPRYTMLETIREFASEQLVARGEEPAVRQAHASYFLRIAQQEGLAHFLPDGERRLDALEAERANMRAALTWWGASGQPEHRLSHAAALGGFWYTRIHVREGKEWLARALAEHNLPPSPARARALVWLSLIEYFRGEMNEAARNSAEGLRLCQELDDLWATEPLVIDHSYAPDRQSLRALTEAFAHYALGVAIFHLGDANDATACFQAGRATSEAIPDVRLSALMVGNCTRSLGIVAGERGDFDEAERLYGEVVSLCQSVEFMAGVRRALGDLAYLALLRGDYATALERFKDVLAQEDLGPSPLALHDDLQGAAMASAYLERSERAVRCLAASEAFGQRLGLDTSIPSERVAWNGAITAAQRALGESAFRSAWSEGRSMPPAEAIALILTFQLSTTRDEAQVSLSTREMEVLRLLVAGHTDRAIGETLFISHRTVEFHVSRILAKLGASKRSGAVAAALASRLVDLPLTSTR